MPIHIYLNRIIHCNHNGFEIYFGPKLEEIVFSTEQREKIEEPKAKNIDLVALGIMPDFTELLKTAA